ncbi:TIGR04255 family protein [Streptomyces sp. P17]|uniref:TIGR04255 family protein n=1 Tax=Streptomyces sp. P17 TaxID=3074716 RepID=UPI0028F43EED|nr:TIGR04255 family protein [Streptomyces sp. P17]MDT9699282.1 TIGR04255 family protein [Streptomyces sp. P17]
MTSLHDSDADLPLAGLPSAGRTLLRTAPVELAIAEIRFASVGESVSIEQALAIKELMEQQGISYPSMEPAQKNELTVEFGPSGASPQVQVRSKGWQFSQGEGQTLATILPDSLVVQTSQYERWSVSLQPALHALLRGAETHLKPQLLQRLGVRYVNRLIDPNATSALAWRGRISDSFLGPVLDPVLGEKVVAAQQQLELSLGDAQGALLRHGAFRDAAAQNAVSYLMDIDVFDASMQRFSSADVMEKAKRLNRTALSLLKQAIEPTYWEELPNRVAGKSDSD